MTGLVHRNRDIRANDGSDVAIETLAGDVSQPHFGWSEADFARIAQTHDLLIHCAATVRFDLTDEEFARFHHLNDAYKARFGFSFVIAVRGQTRETVLATFEARLKNDLAAEKAEALRNIGLIARFRLEDMLAG